MVFHMENTLPDKNPKNKNINPFFSFHFMSYFGVLGAFMTTV